jgi:hypothetical protein
MRAMFPPLSPPLELSRVLTDLQGGTYPSDAYGLLKTRMNRIVQARERLEKALSRLETAARREKEGPNLAELTAELDDLRARNLMLDQRNRAVGDRLDAAIARLKTLIKE